MKIYSVFILFALAACSAPVDAQTPELAPECEYDPEIDLKRCNGLQIERCAPDGTWEPATHCEDDIPPELLHIEVIPQCITDAYDVACVLITI